MSDLRPLNNGETVQLLDGYTPREAEVLENVEDGYYRIEYLRLGVHLTDKVVHRTDLYAAEDTAVLIEDLRGIAEDANDTADELLQQLNEPSAA